MKDAFWTLGPVEIDPAALFRGVFSLIHPACVELRVTWASWHQAWPDGELLLEGKFNKDYAFHWADFNNEPINDWKALTSGLLSIPMVHQLIAFTPWRMSRTVC